MLTSALLAATLALLAPTGGGVGAGLPPPAPPAPPAVPAAPARVAGRLAGDWPRQDARKVSLSGAMKLDAALQRIAGAGGFNLVASTGPLGERSVTLALKDVPVQDALEAVLEGTPLVATRKGSIVTVAPGASAVLEAGKRRLVYQLGPPDREQRRRSKAELKEGPQGAPDAGRGADEPDGDADEADDEGDGGSGRDQVSHGDVTVPAGQHPRSVVALRGNVRFEPGSGAREATAVMGSVDLGPGAEVEREVVAIGGDVHVGPGARVGRDAVSIGGKIVVDPGGEVEGQQTSIGVPGLAGIAALAGSKPFLFSGSRSPVFGAARALTEFVIFFLLGLVLWAIAPRRVEGVGAGLFGQPLKVVLVGLLGTLALPLLALLLTVTVVGIPLVAVQVLAVLAAAVLGFTALALALGRRLPVHPRRGQAVVQLALGTALLVAVTHVPVLGGMVWVTAWLFAFGAVLRTRFGGERALPTTLPPATPAAPPPGAPVA
ncbi:STN domain-containing protein [Anaeromyxobacter paludicola]|uniref:Secretin/TonB short N-terminal domain-containing protein n=1 Tax=Anaeromyxobacter paludicola TaxID=2918171 RepID=A0ABM7X759_9BACT|nr:STN domain-containing protein [Anaeromyxobacter paludicola]BDG07633.1 hypothetical protein AMPC_07460 [Anaeromyxobacter paludicola]